jgi:SAM-dependent methyltransferase
MSIYGDAKPIKNNKWKNIILSTFKKNKNKITTIDIGSSGDNIFDDVSFNKLDMTNNIMEYEYQFMDTRNNIIMGDICKCPEIKTNSFDISYCWNVLEHVLNPFDAVAEIVRITKKNGIIIINVPFIWNYHEVPIDYWRFTHAGLRYLLTKNNDTVILDYGYHSRLSEDETKLFKGKKIPKAAVNVLIIAKKL